VRETADSSPAPASFPGAEHVAFDPPPEPRTAMGWSTDHLGAVAEAIDAGVDVRGYLVWSLLDNSEWAHGHAKPLSIVHVDPATQTRTIKQSGHWYRALIARAGTP